MNICFLKIRNTESVTSSSQQKLHVLQKEQFSKLLTSGPGEGSFALSMVIKEVVAAGIMIMGVRDPIKTEFSRYQIGYLKEL